MKTWDPLVCSYLAGFFDGEGCFSIYINHPKKTPDRTHYLCRICITNTDRNIIEWLKENFGGNFHKRTRNPKCKDVYMWSISGEPMLKVLHAMYPHLRAKRKHADVMIRFRSTFDPNKHSCQALSDEIIQIRAECRQELHILNHRGTSSPSALSPSALR